MAAQHSDTPAWLFSFVDLAFLILLAMTQVGSLDTEKGLDLGELVVPRVGEKSPAEPLTGGGNATQVRVYPPGDSLPVFELALARADGRLGSALRRSGVDCAALRDAGTNPPAAPAGQAPCVMASGFGRLTATGMTMTELATVGLSNVTGRPVLDRTGLRGPFEWTLVWTPDNLPPRAPGTPPDQPIRVNGLEIDPNGPPLATALQEQLGLKLQSTTGPVEVVVIDRVEKPSEN